MNDFPPGRHRRAQAADAAAADPDHSYAVQITGIVILVIAPNAIGVLADVHDNADGVPDRYTVLDTDGGEPYDIPHDATVTLSTTKIGVLHHRCDHDRAGLSTFETETQARTYVRHALTRYWMCNQVAQQDTAAVAGDRPHGTREKTPGPASPQCTSSAALARQPTGKDLARHPVEDPDHDCGSCSGDHRPVVPPMAGIAPYCACGWTPFNDISIHDHLKDMSAWPPAPIVHSPRGYFGARP
ncbi:hypothetical protein [Streptomyces sp. AGS-58]|uniref:hypothetical protein n=1 Tax=unclassified Streptomyces TaxID=2593676 RepID=UPI0035A34915